MFVLCVFRHQGPPNSVFLRADRASSHCLLSMIPKHMTETHILQQEEKRQTSTDNSDVEEIDKKRNDTEFQVHATGLWRYA